MRLAPVALRFWHDRPRLLATAAEQSRTTHGAEEAVDACRAFVELLAGAIAGSPRAAVLAPRPFEGAEAITRIMAGSRRGRPRNEIRSSGYVVHTLEAAVWSVARTGNFRNAVLLAANPADDADTAAAVAGQLAGALYGLSGIPDGWLQRLAWKDRLLETAARLLPPSPAEPRESSSSDPQPSKTAGCRSESQTPRVRTDRVARTTRHPEQSRAHPGRRDHDDPGPPHPGDVHGVATRRRRADG